MVSQRTYDVFLSYSQQDAGTAQAIHRALADAGFGVFRGDEVSAGEVLPERAREALVESRAVVVLLTPASMHSANLGLEVGAAMAWRKPIFVLADQVPVKDYPPVAHAAGIYPVKELDRLVKSLRTQVCELNAHQRQILTRVYQTMKRPVDVLMSRPDLLEEFSAEFNKHAGTHLPGEQLAQELLRLRKGGHLAAIGKRSAVTR